MARQFDRLLKGVLRNLCVDKEEAGFCCLLWFSLRNRKKSSVLGVCMGAVGYKVDGKGIEEEGTDMASTLAFPHGTKECTESLDTETHGCRSGGMRVPQPCSDLSHTEALNFLYWCQGNVGKFNLEPWSTIKSFMMGFWQFVRTCKLQKQCYCSIRHLTLYVNVTGKLCSE